jgi:LytS/YehU family sensor histidine kinase
MEGGRVTPIISGGSAFTRTTVQIPVLCIQPLVENAIKHGIAPKAGRGMLIVTAKVVDGEVLISVQDSSAGTIGVNPPFERSGAGVGLANVRRRLQLSFGAQADLVIDSSPTGTRVQFAIPRSPPTRASGEVVAYHEAR